MSDRIVVDTSVFIAALIGRRGPNREVLRRCLQGRYRPLLGNALVAEYEDVMRRQTIRAQCPATPAEMQALLDALCAAASWVPVYFLLRPNLRDEGDNHLVELAVAGDARWLVSNNVRDFKNAQLALPGIAVRTPEQLLEES